MQNVLLEISKEISKTCPPNEGGLQGVKKRDG